MLTLYVNLSLFNRTTLGNIATPPNDVDQIYPQQHPFSHKSIPPSSTFDASSGRTMPVSTVSPHTLQGIRSWDIMSSVSDSSSICEDSFMSWDPSRRGWLCNTDIWIVIFVLFSYSCVCRIVNCPWYTVTNTTRVVGIVQYTDEQYDLCNCIKYPYQGRHTSPIHSSPETPSPAIKQHFSNRRQDSQSLLISDLVVNAL